MENIMKKLSKIEETAEAVIASAENQKFEVEKEIQAKRDEFDRQLDEETSKQLDLIREEGKKKMDAALKAEYEKNHAAIDRLETDFAKHHSEYAKEILERITEV